MTVSLTHQSTPLWFRATASLGLIWNAYGVAQFLAALRATPESLMAGGLTPEQAQVMTSYPGWMTAAFALGTLAGLAGCVLLLIGRAAALPVFAASLAGYLVLYVGDITEGVFAAMGAPQVVILSVVVAIAAGLFWLARRGKTQGFLA